MFYSNYDTSSYDFVSFTNSAKLIKEKKLSSVAHDGMQ